jgi:amino acid transporter
MKASALQQDGWHGEILSVLSKQRPRAKFSRLAYCILIGTEISTVAELFGFGFTTEYLREFNYPRETLQWGFGLDTSPDVWVGIFLLAILLLNLLPVRAYGEVEYVFGCFKMVVITGLILFNVVINVKNVQDGRSSGRFATYEAPYGFFSNNVTITTSKTDTYTYTGGGGHLLGMWSAMTTIFFSLQGFYTVSVSAAENKHLDRDESIKLATRKISLRVILLYCLLVFTVGLNVPYTDFNLRDSSISSIRKGQNSPFIIAMVHSGVTGWPSFLNAFFIFSAFSVAVNALYISSRLLHALASIRNVWPETGWAYSIKSRLETTSRHGVPVAAIFVSWLFGLLGFLGAQPSPAKILGRMATYSTCSMLIVYACVCLSFLSFKLRTIDGDPADEVVITGKGGTLLNRNASDYPYKSHLQWVRALYGLVGCLLLLLFNGWRSFLSPFSAPDFVASYINLLVFVVLIAAYHVKDEREWNPLRWTRRVTMDINNPTVTREKNLELRKGRLHRANKKTFFCKENATRILEFVWVWLK